MQLITTVHIYGMYIHIWYVYTYMVYVYTYMVYVYTYNYIHMKICAVINIP